ncbi:MAG: ABC transporter ATP-binding protein [Planctomycetia bacterium]|nr:ABC transporter ATP-binding protein [Planctomycetia bacterium]
MPHLVVENLTKEYPTRTGPLRVLGGVSLELSAGQNLAILGPSGSGKSTLLSIIGTLDTPTAGSVRLGDRNPFELAEPDLARFRHEQIGFVFQEHFLLGSCTALENVLVPMLAEGGRPAADTIERAKSLLARVGLADRSDHRPAELSGGERQRVAIARALINRPRLLLADEPTGNLDRTSAASIGRLLVEIQAEEQAMLIVVTHSPELAALLQQRRELDGGQLV